MFGVHLATAAVGVLLAGPFQYIVPVQGDSGPLEPGVWQAKLDVVNPSDEMLTLTIEVVYPMNGQALCPRELREFLIPPRGAIRVNATACPVRSLQALVFTTEKPVIPVVDASALASCGEPQSIPFETEWFPPDREVLIARADFRPTHSRVNLILVNPDDEPLIATYRRFSTEEQNEYDVLVPARSLIIHPVNTPDFACGSGGPIPGPFPDQTCGITVRATGRFYAGASVITNETNDAVYRRGTLLGDVE